MKWMRSPFTEYHQGDFIPIVIGCIMLFLSLPGFIMLLIDAELKSSMLVASLLVLFGFGNVLGLGILLLGIRLCSYPGSLTYRITHGRIFSR